MSATSLNSAPTMNVGSGRNDEKPELICSQCESKLFNSDPNHYIKGKPPILDLTHSMSTPSTNDLSDIDPGTDIICIKDRDNPKEAKANLDMRTWATPTTL